MLDLLIALAGLPVGILLSYIANEELKSGRTYFLWLKYTLFAGIIIAADVVFIVHNRLFASVMFSVLAVMVLFLTVKFNTKYGEIFNYALFIISYGFHQELLISSLIFLYGFPAGTLLMCHDKYHDKI